MGSSFYSQWIHCQSTLMVYSLPSQLEVRSLVKFLSRLVPHGFFTPHANAKRSQRRTTLPFVPYAPMHHVLCTDVRNTTLYCQFTGCLVWSAPAYIILPIRW